ncbi:MAG: MotA/TolQ/ExbB proton channel family protein [Deltaproteobacteria bacterium]|nr:MotA/TolQ/ExbB proton channel family protein [Deltaproteobacteria bacterium]
MHFVVGFLLLVGALVFTAMFHESRFDGFFHPPALVLVGLTPLAIALMGHGFRSLVQAFRDLARALRRDRSLRAFDRELAQFSDLLRRGRMADAANYLDRCESPLRDYGVWSLERYSREEFAEVVAAVRSEKLHGLKDSEEVFQTLAQVTPSVGMVGTVLGLVGMLVKLQSFNEISAGMALALLTTFYGLLIGRCLYSPLVAAIRAYVFSLQSIFAKLESAYALHTVGRSVDAIVGPAPANGTAHGANGKGDARALTEGNA